MRLHTRAIIAERRLDLRRNGKSRPITVRIGRPQRDPLPGGDWMCPVEIAGIPRRHSIVRASYGVDEVQALLLAFQLIRLELLLLQDDGLALTWLEPDGEDLGFPCVVEGEPTPSEWRRRRTKRAPRIPRPSNGPLERPGTNRRGDGRRARAGRSAPSR
jgi:uncharacterized protein DUF6968